MATAEHKQDARGRGRKAPSPLVRAELYKAVRPCLLRRGAGVGLKKRRGRFGRAVAGLGAFASMVGLFLLGFVRRELLTLLLVFGAVLLDTNQHSTPAAETYTSTQAASFYSNANGGGSNGTIRFTITPTLGSTSYVGGNFHALFADNSQHGGVWLNDANLELYTTPGDALVFSQAMTWSALQTITITILATGTKAVTISGATTGNGTFTFSTAPNYFDSTQDLGVGSFPGSSAFRFAGVIGDVDDGNTSIAGAGAITFADDTVAATSTSAVAGAAAIALAADTVASTAAATIVGTGTPQLADDTLAATAVSAIAGAGAVTLADDALASDGNAGANGGAITFDDDVVAGSAAASVVGAGAIQLANDTTAGTGTVDVVGAGAIALANDTTAGAGTVPISGAGSIQLADDVIGGTGSGPGGFGPGVTTSALATFGHSLSTMSAPGGYLPAGGGGADVDGRTPTAVNSQASGSSFYAAVGRPVAIAGSKNLTDNKGNNALWTEIRRDNYGTFDPTFAPWEAAIFECIDGAGGTNHVVTTPGVAGDELHLGWTEIQQGHYRVATTAALRLTGQTQNSAPLATNGPAYVIVDWFGARGTFGAEGFDWTVTAIGENADPALGWKPLDSRTKNHTDGWFQWKRWIRYFATRQAAIQFAINEATLNPPQPGIFYASAFQQDLFIDGDAAIQLANDTLAATGVVSATGNAAIQLANDTLAATASAAVTAAGLAQSTADATTVAGTATVTVVGDAAIAFADDTVAGAGVVADGPVGAGAVTLADDTVAGSAASAVAGGGGITPINDTVAGTGTTSTSGGGTVALADDTVAGTGSVAIVGAGAVQLADDGVAGTGIAVDPGTILGVGAITFDDDATSSTAGGEIAGVGVIAFANDLVAGSGIVDVGNLPPKPIAVTFPRPAPLPHEPTRTPNPRPVTPDNDPGLRRNQRPSSSFVEDMAPVADDMRQMLVDFGLRFYEVFSVVVRWSAGERGRGVPKVVFERPFLPVPKVEGIDRVSRSLRSGGTVARGEIRLSQISPRYTQDDIISLFPRELRDDEEHFIEVRGDGRDGATVRARYTVSGVPERRALEWTVRLEKQDEDRTRGGRPR